MPATPNDIFDQIRLLDGGMGSQLSTMGFDISRDVLWSARLLIDNPEAIIKVHEEYLKAGATVIETCSYQASLQNLQKCLNESEEKCTEILKSSVNLVKQAISNYNYYEHEQNSSSKKRIYIAGSVGSYGSMLHDRSEYTGSYMNTIKTEEIFNYYYDQAKPLVEAGVDILAFETIPALKEAEIVLKVMEKPELKTTPFWISFYCKDCKHSGFGDDFKDVIDHLSKSDSLQAIGINCTNPSEISSLMSRSKSLKPFVIYPNNYTTKPNECLFADLIPKWIKLGAKIVGGCCGVSPENIKEMASIITNF